MCEEVYVRLKVVSNTLAPKAITSIIGIPFDRSWEKGDLRKNTIIVEKNYGWILESGLPKHSPLNEHIDQLIKRISPFSDKLKMLSNQHSIEFSCVIYSKEVPSLYFDNVIIHAIDSLGANFDIDLYIINDS